MKEIQKISVCGLGKLGACIAATYAAAGYEVIGIDIDPRKVEAINNHRAPVEEPGLAEMVKAAGSKLKATIDWNDIASTDLTFFITPSPSLPDGSFSNEFLLGAMRQAAKAIKAKGKKGHLFVCSSTTTPGSCDSELIPAIEQELAGVCGRDFGFCYNPEFIALGNVINGLLEPDMVLIGESDSQSGALLESLYAKYNRNTPHVCRMSVVSAELTKISVNSFITTKISFTNQLRMIAEKFPKADIHTILDAIGSDTRIGKKYLRAGLSYGGPCFPRDNRLLAHVARKNGLAAPLAEASDIVNRQANEHLFEKVTSLISKEQKVLVLGLSYKPDTYIVEEAAGFILAQRLKAAGYKVVVHDYGATPLNTAALKDFEYLQDPGDISNIKDLGVIALCCPWPQYKKVIFPQGIRVIAEWKL